MGVNNFFMATGEIRTVTKASVNVRSCTGMEWPFNIQNENINHKRMKENNGAILSNKSVEQETL